MSSPDIPKLPAHIAIIMDGNGRWAQQQDRPRSFGHRTGSDAVRRTVRACRKRGISALTLYAFSEQNWQRPSEEVDVLMALLEEFILKEREEILGNGIRFRAIGRLTRLPKRLQDLMLELEHTSNTNQGMVLSIALSYGGREEITDAAKVLAKRVAENELDPDAISEALLEAELPSMDVGAVDLLIRTGGEWRISNFVLWGAAYAELYFTDRYWPDFDEHDLDQAIASFQGRERRFGRVLGPDANESSQGSHVKSA